MLGNNMYAYCNSNPINSSDLSGLRPVSILERFGDTSIPAPPRREKSETAITVSVGVSLSVTIGPNVYGGQIALVTDSLGVSEYQITYYSSLSSSALASTPSIDKMITQISTYEKMADILEFSLTGNMSFYNAPSVNNLYNEGYQIGGAIGTGYAIAVDYNVIPNDSNTPYKGITISAGMGSSDIHAVMGTTRRLATSRISVYDLVQSAYNAVWGVY